ncbi:hypothetical protein PLICRDRAFT_35022 [Plicaturopsis crispa FD-325 SS-3]|nr:hypothetical protein PLICRDRAFT_35022 [Plicaturopsis crispa FD-325 SS-3]
MLSRAAAIEQLKEIDNRIDELDTVRAGLLHELDNVDASLKAERARRAAVNNNSVPVGSLPTEILTMVFLEADALHLAAARSRFRVVVTSVCRRWRSVAVDLPRWWMNVRVRMSDMEHHSASSILSDILERSQVTTLSLTLAFDGDVSPSCCGRIMDLVLTHLYHLEHLSLVLFSTCIPWAASKRLGPARAPVLRSFTIDGTSRGKRSARIPADTTFFRGGAPSLRQLRCIQASPQISLPPNCRSISTLDIRVNRQDSGIPFSQLPRFLESFPDLETLRITDDFVAEWPASHVLLSGEPTTLPSLRSMSLKMGSTSAQSRNYLATSMLACLTAPLLETVELNRLTKFNEDLFAVFVNTGAVGISRFPAVRTLSIVACSWHLYESLWLVEDVFPQLSHISFKGGVDETDGAMLLAMLQDPDGLSLAQDLTNLTLGHISDVILAALCEILETRSNVGFTVPTVHLLKNATSQLSAATLSLLKTITTVKEVEG